MWIYVVLAIFIIALQLALVMFGGWFSNFVFGLVSLIAVVYYFDLMGEGLPLGYFIPVVMLIFVFFLWISALTRSEVI